MNIPGTDVAVERLGVHLPRWSLDRQALAATWSAKSGPGRRTVANFDEDSLTMGVEAALAALGPDPAARADIDAVLFATTTPVFTEKQHAVLVATVLQLPTDQCFDVGASLRSGLDAIRLATALIGAGTARRVLVVAADRRDLQPGGSPERLSGDAGTAVVVGPGPGLLTITAQHAIGDPGAGIWRGPGDRWSAVADERFVTTELLTPWLLEAAEAVSADVAVAGFAAPLPKAEKAVTARLGVPGIPGTLDAEVGYCGVAHPLLALALALAGSHAGDRVLVGAAGDGAAALAGTVVEPADCGIGTALQRRRELPVGVFHRMRGQLPVEPVNPYTSEMLLRREQSVGLELQGTRCRKCGRAHFPPRRICLECKAIDAMDVLDLPRSGTLYTHTVEHLFPVPVNELIMGVVDVGDVRVYTQVTDTDPAECAPGRPVELVLRRLHDGGGLPHYFWKAKVVG